ncbi:pilus assembly protein PilZ [Shewanella corallii]|uniref:Pilus assembly protein PilZ n=1 Tax=Shewanella corallii TaxID=560080 RepID=A0ABT0N9C7_9GAMM|nr:PilZ domain-containing protein [Shewanella corallii]MCL2915029.1 pilus assembly protein PilZ [Shewanella corallii]
MKQHREDPRRAHPRISLRLSKDSDLLLACDGVTVSLHHPQWWKPGRIGMANIKDISRGGVGLISSTSLHSGQELKLRMDDISLPVVITHGRRVQGPLKFYGASYRQVSDELLLQAMKWVRAKKRQYRFPRDKGMNSLFMDDGR